MPLFMDVHEELPEGASFDDVVAAHEADMKIQDQYGVKYVGFWMSEDDGKVFCLAEAPDAETAATVHREAHGLVASRIHKVRQGG